MITARPARVGAADPGRAERIDVDGTAVTITACGEPGFFHLQADGEAIGRLQVHPRTGRWQPLVGSAVATSRQVEDRDQAVGEVLGRWREAAARWAALLAQPRPTSPGACLPGTGPRPGVAVEQCPRCGSGATPWIMVYRRISDGALSDVIDYIAPSEYCLREHERPVTYWVAGSDLAAHYAYVGTRVFGTVWYDTGEQDASAQGAAAFSPPVLDEIEACTRLTSCGEDPVTACSLSGVPHLHPAAQAPGSGPGDH